MPITYSCYTSTGEFLPLHKVYSSAHEFVKLKEQDPNLNTVEMIIDNWAAVYETLDQIRKRWQEKFPNDSFAFELLDHLEKDLDLHSFQSGRYGC